MQVRMCGLLVANKFAKPTISVAALKPIDNNVVFRVLLTDEALRNRAQATANCAVVRRI